jgi:MFS family permease
MTDLVETTWRGSAIEAPAITTPAPPSSVLLSIAYCSMLVLLSATATGIISIGSKYVLKDQLQLDPDRISLLNILIDVSWYFSFVLGMMRDRWKPFGRYDRLVLLACPVITVFCTILSGIIPLRVGSFCTLLTIAIAGGVAANVVLTGQMAAVSKGFGITGRVGALMGAIPLLVNGGLSALTGLLIDRWHWAGITYASAAISLTVVVAAFCQPHSIIDSIYRIRPQLAADHVREPLRQSIRRIFSGRATLLCIAIAGLWTFTPGWNTPLFYQFTDHLKLTAPQFESTQTAMYILDAAASLLYFAICLRFSARSLLLLGIIIGIVGNAAVAFVDNYHAAVLACAWFGVTSGIGNAAVYDLVFRVTPRHLEAVVAMLMSSTMVFAYDISDLVGSVLYEYGGFLAAMVAATVVGVLIPPLILLIPRRIYADPEGSVIDDKPA